MSVRPPEPDDLDDDLVDAWLRSALQHAPDGEARPPAALRQAVLQAARASLPRKPTWWQRLLDNGPSMQRTWATAAGIGAFGLALNLAWHMTSAPPSDEYSRSPVASVSESVPPPRPQAQPPAEMEDRQAKAAAAGAMADAPDVPLSAAPPAQPPLARRDAAPMPVAPPKLAEPAPAVVATAPQPFPAPPPAAPAPAAPPRPAEADSEAKKALAKEEYARSDRAAEVAAANATADKAMADERRRAFAPPADSVRSEDLAAAAKPAAAPAPMAEAQARAKQAPSASMGIAPAPVAAPAASPAPSSLPEPLARMQLAFSRADDWPSGWMLQGSAEVAVPRRAWWQAMMAGTAGRWQALQEPVPQSVPGSLTWHVHGADGTRFTLMMVDGQAWLQSGGSVWRAPWSVPPGPVLR